MANKHSNNKKRKRASSDALLRAAKAFNERGGKNPGGMTTTTTTTVVRAASVPAVPADQTAAAVGGLVPTGRIGDTTGDVTNNNDNGCDVTNNNDDACDDDDDDDDDSVSISDADLATTLRTLQKLVAAARSPSSSFTSIHSKRFKELRRTLHPLVVEQLLQSYDKGVDYRHKVTLALSQQRWSDALAALEACKDFRQYPKQGTIQRWVRDCTTAGNAVGTCHTQLLQAILRLNNNSYCGDGENGENGDGENDGDGAPTDPAASSNNNNNFNNNFNNNNFNNNNKHDPGQALADHLANNNTSSMTILDGWKWWEDKDGITTGRVEAVVAVESSGETKGGDAEDDGPGRAILDHDNDDDVPTISSIKSRIVYQEDGADRTPPNHWDLILHTTEPGSIRWSSSIPPAPMVACHRIPFLPDHPSARVLSNVLTRHECRQLMAVTTHLGYRKDHPVTLNAPTGIDSCEWMVDASIAQTLLDRVRPHLPAKLELPGRGGGGSTSGSGHPKKQRTTTTVQLHGINPRWRCFRYGQDCVYRPHLDGSWPQCYLDEDGAYQCPTTDRRSDVVRSYLTFLIYLNDDFDGGETRFYLHDGTARGVVPRTGCVTIFPQGNTASLIHEGTKVTRGTKYVIRTDVLYGPPSDDDVAV